MMANFTSLTARYLGTTDENGGGVAFYMAHRLKAHRLQDNEKVEIYEFR